MTDKIQALRGMNDITPDKAAIWRHAETVLFQCLAQYGYEEIRFPILESTMLFKRTIGEVTDIVEKEMYTFNDLNGDSITLRPEGTAGCVRACIENGLLYNQTQKLWYLGPMFRHERPQKGRYRQFTQFGAEAYGFSGPYIEVELLLLCQKMWQELGLADHIRLEVNTLGELAERQHYKEVLVEYFRLNYDKLDQDSKNRLDRNPLRILDSKNPEMQALIAGAPKLYDSLGEQSRSHFDTLCAGLTALQIPFTVNPVLVRGLDYYGHTVFEWVTDKLGSQATVCAGGRYDILVEHLGGAPTSAVGFAMGLERLILLMEVLQVITKNSDSSSVFIIASGEQAEITSLGIAESLRQAMPQVQVLSNLAGGSMKSQFKKADKSGARIALILGDNEIQSKQITVKDLRSGVEQVTINQDQLVAYLNNYFEQNQDLFAIR